MTEGHDELPPLGERTPARPARPEDRPAWYRGTPVVAGAALLVGLLIGMATGRLFGEAADHETSDAAAERPASTTTVPMTTTTLASVPEECVETIRSAEQALLLLDQGLRTLRELQLADLDRIVADMQRLRGNFDRRARECLEIARS